MYIKLSETPKTRTIDVLCRGEVIVEITETGEIVGIDIRKPVIFPEVTIIEQGRLIVPSGDILPQNKE